MADTILVVIGLLTLVCEIIQTVVALHNANKKD